MQNQLAMILQAAKGRKREIPSSIHIITDNSQNELILVP